VEGKLYEYATSEVFPPALWVFFRLIYHENSWRLRVPGGLVDFAPLKRLAERSSLEIDCGFYF